MSTELVLFDYAELDVETRIVVRQRTDEIKTLVRRSAQDIIDIGSKLLDVKEQLGHGSFGGWLESEFGWSESAAQKFMSVSTRFKSVNFTEMNIGASALYLLAAPSTPEPARIEAIERAQSGERITHTVAREIVAEHKPMPVDTAFETQYTHPKTGQATTMNTQKIVKASETAALDREISRLGNVLIGRGWGIHYAPMPQPCEVIKGQVKFAFSNREDKQGLLEALRTAKAYEEFGAAEPAAPTRPLSDQDYDELIRGLISTHVKLPVPKSAQMVRENSANRLAWLKSTPTSLFAAAVAPNVLFDHDQFARIKGQIELEFARLATGGNALGANPARRLLTDQEANAVLWRVIERQVTAPATATLEQVTAAQLRWFKSAPFAIFKEALNPGVALSDEQFVRVGERVEAELTLRLAKAKQGMPASEPTRPVLTSLAAVITAPDDGEAEEEWADDEDEEQEVAAEVAAEQAPPDGDEYYTPPYIIAAARQVLGTIDLDPASCALAQRVIQAEAYLTKADDGLSVPWYGTVWLNPPYSKPAPFVTKLIIERDLGNTTAAIIITNNGTETAWGQALLARYPVCFVGAGSSGGNGSRISFWQADPDEPKKGNRYAQMIFYLGNEPEKFAKVFGQFGVIKA
jgi:hypothetical protein